MILAFDIETVPIPEACQKYVELVGVKPRANLKDPEKIRADIEAKTKEIAFGSKGAVKWWLGKVVCISVGSETFSGDDEQSLLLKFSKHLEAIEKSHDLVTLCGFYSRYFDEVFLRGRFMAHRMKIPYALRVKKPITDIMDLFGGSHCDAKLADIAFGFGMGSKPINSADVYTYAQQNHWGAIEGLCEFDKSVVEETIFRYNIGL